MWDELFDMDMFDEHRRIVVNCPNHRLERELATMLTDYGVRYPSGEKLISVDPWTSHRGDFCYFIDVPEKVARRGPREHANNSFYKSYKKCTFDGCDHDPDLEISTADFEAIIAGG